MNSNRLLDNSDSLSCINYEKVLDKIKDNLDEINLKTINGNIYLNNIHYISNKIANEIINTNKKIINILELNKSKNIATLSINHKDSILFGKLIRKLDKEIGKKVEEDLFLNNQNQFQDLNFYKNKPLNPNINFGLNFEFNSSKQIRNKVSTKSIKTNERLRVDEVEINIDTFNLDKNLKESLKNHIESISFIDEDLKEDLFDEIDKNNLKVNNVLNILDSEVLARIKRSISYIYLQYLCENTENIYLKDYLRRFKILEDFLTELSKKAQNESIILDEDITNIFSRGDAFDELPIKGIVEGNIYEDKSSENKLCKFALKLKLNGNVNQDGTDDKVENKNNRKSKSCYEYYLDKMCDEESTKYKRVKIFLLYMFMLKDLGDLNYDPVKDYYKIKEYIEDTDKGTPIETFDKVCIGLVKRLNSDKPPTLEKVYTMCNNLDKIIKYNVSSLKTKEKHYSLNLILHKDIIDNSTLEYMEIFKLQKHDKQYLKYVSIGEKVDEFSNSIISSLIRLKIKSYNLYETGESIQTESSFDLKDLKSIPVVMYPASLNNPRKYRELFNELVENTLPNNKCIYLATLQDEGIIANENNHYLYRLIYQTLSYLVIDNILRNIEIDNKKSIFIPIIRYHNSKEEKEASKCDEFIREHSKVLENLFSNQYRCSSQGFDLNKNSNYTYKNAMTSLYSKVPKHFDANDSNIDKVAMLVVTSKKADNSYSTDDNITTLFGDVVLFDKENNKVKCDIYSSFSDNYRSCDLYTKPTILSDVVSNLYDKGYKNILYIAKAPYTSTLNITKKEDLFFMDEKVINLLRGEKYDLVIYPLYYDNFYAIDYRQNANTHALYIEDTEELDAIINSNSKSTASVFNLYSGKCVGKNTNDKRYRSVVSYQTLYNLYENKILNVKINEGLIANSNTKKTLMNYITMYHYARYEGSYNASIKINPYSNLMGDDGLSGLSTKEFEFDKYTKFKFNSLAYLTEVKKSIEGDL